MSARGETVGLAIVPCSPQIRNNHNQQRRGSGGKCKLPNCGKPRWYDEASGCLHDYCGRMHAQKAYEMGIGRPLQPVQQVCRLRGCRRPAYFEESTGRLHDFCGRTHAQLAMERGEWPPVPSYLDESDDDDDAEESERRQCGLPGCTRPVFHDPANPNRSFDFCCRTHAEKAEARSLLPPAEPGVERVWRGSSGTYAVSLLMRKHPKYSSVAQQFLKGWKHSQWQPSIQRILQIRNPPDVYENYKAYVAHVGNEKRRFHGTTLACNFAVDLKYAPCSQQNCSVCNICTVGFSMDKVRRHNFQRFGFGLYFSATSSKSHSYNDNSERVGPRGERLRVMFLCKVATGREYVTNNSKNFNGLPRGYDSVVGVPGNELNHDETVIYNDVAAIPSYLIVYSYR
ncbi:PARP catalytic domain-containing protein [Balamuthia mandrillaris]